MYAVKQRQPDLGPIELATQRLNAALEALSSAVDRRKEMDRQHEALLAQLHAMGNDRARLAQELDDACARAMEMGAVGQEVTQRLDVAMGTIRDVLATHGG